MHIHSTDNYQICICVLRNDIEHLAKFYETFTSQDTNNLAFDFQNDKFYKVALNDETIVGIGSVSVSPFTYDNLRRFIHPNYRNKNIGEKLLNYIINDARNNDVKRLIGNLQKKFSKGAEFFKVKGFKVIDGICIEDQEYLTVIMQFKNGK